MDLAWCVADPHFGPSDPALDVFGRLVLAFRESGTPTLVLLGDMFPVWLARKTPQTEEEAKLLAFLKALREEGRRVVYLVGNRDYFLEALGARVFDSVCERWNLDTPAGKIRFEHGDLINSSDLNYLRWRRLSRGRTVSLLFRALPWRSRRAIAARLERAMDSTNRSYKEYRPARELASWAEGLGRDGFRGAVVGHFHLDAEEEVGGIRVRFLPQFREDGAHLRIRDDGSWALERCGSI